MPPATSSPLAISLREGIALSGRFPLLAGIDLDVAPGEAVLVEGPNGAGKTSLLRVCAGLVPLTSGRLTVLGLDPARQRTAVRRQVGFLSHSAHLYDDLTVGENVRFAVRAARGDAARIDAACQRLGLAGRLLATSASKLSAGQRRRVALAVLVARWPAVWLLDEPHAGLDASARRILGELVAEATSVGTTVVIASHEPEFAASLATRAVTVAGGRITAARPLRPVPVSSPRSGTALEGTASGGEGQAAHVA
jgi:heme ABC exporter ATP-binding subunit CcmA